jgi:hypothetical protein
MRLFAISLVCFSLVVFAGCGGGGGGTPPPPPTTLTRVIADVNWPERSRDINAMASALSIQIVLKGASETGSDFVWNIARGSTASAFKQKYTSTTTAKVGTWDYSAKFYTLAGGQGAVVGEAQGTATIAENGSGFPDLSPGSRVSQVAVATNRNLSIGLQKDIPFTATDATGNVIPVTAGSATWNILVGQTTLRFVSGKAEGLANGTASVTATVDGKTSAPVLVSVGPKTGTLTVNVKDPTGALVPKGTVTLFQSGFQVKQAAAGNGTISFATLNQGATEIKVTTPGFHDAQTTAQVVTSPTPVVNVTITPLGTPVATTLGTRLINVASNLATFETDIAVTGEDGLAITSIDPSTFLIDPAVVGGAAATFGQESAVLADATPAGDFSTFLAVDATQSMRGADPTGSRVEGIKAFFGAIPAGSNAAFGYFPSTNQATLLKSFPEIGFVSVGTAYYPEIDNLRNLALVDTPLYDATVQAVDFTAAAPNANRSVVVLTDGHQTLQTSNLAAAISAATSKNTRVFTVSLGLQTYTNELAELSQKTGGGTSLATNSVQLTSYYRSLPALLKGALKVYRVRWTVTRDGVDFPAGSKIVANVKIPGPEGLLLAPFYVKIN